MTTYGYLRVSTDYQDCDAQMTAIKSRYKIDKWVEDIGTGRNTRSVINIVEGFKELGASVISLREGLDINSPSGNMVFQMMCSIAEFESRLIADRVKSGLKAAVKRGVRLGRPMLLDDPKKAKAIEYAKELRAKGMALRKIQ